MPPLLLRPGFPTRERPFAGSPAARWGSGADAIRLPKVEAKGEGRTVNGFPVAEVEAALEGVKEFLVAPPSRRPAAWHPGRRAPRKTRRTSRTRGNRWDGGGREPTGRREA
ncbi:hypothetical protein SHIRM173S_08820 [Streptomyces hirsutus]